MLHRRRRGAHQMRSTSKIRKFEFGDCGPAIQTGELADSAPVSNGLNVALDALPRAGAKKGPTCERAAPSKGNRRYWPTRRSKSRPVTLGNPSQTENDLPGTTRGGRPTSNSDF